jgi:hypothetical protein
MYGVLCSAARSSTVNKVGFIWRATENRSALLVQVPEQKPH